MSEFCGDKILQLTGAEVSVCSPADLREYLTGFRSSFGYVVTDANGSVFYTDMRYLEAARAALAGKGVAAEAFAGLDKIADGHKKVALPVSKINAAEYMYFRDGGFEIIDSTPIFSEAMSVKRPDELEKIRLACRIADRAYTDLLGKIKEGMTENEVAAELEYLMRKYGASGTSFDTIVAFGANSSVPHHETGSAKLAFGDAVLIDFGCKAEGYCSDCTRTFLFGDDGKHGDFKKTYEAVLAAHNLVKSELKEGMSGREADAVARNYLAKFSLDKYFTHSLGHGIGINIHEDPVLSPRSTHILKRNSVFSDEPGVYFEGKYGIRIEDTVTLGVGGVESLTNTDKKLTVL